MSEIRKGYIGNDYVVFSTNRAKRPHAFSKSQEKIASKGKCAFCRGNEHMTPKAIKEVPRGKWKVRLIPNKFPALCEVPFKGEEGKGLFKHYKPYGYHEILIETPEHNKEFHELSEEQLELCFKTLIERYKELLEKKKIVYVTVFKNEGKMAGASLGHTHSQIIASPVFPKKISEKMETSEKYYEKEERCPYCDIIKQEKRIKKRIVTENKEFFVLCPYASTEWIYETWILPKKHISDISELTPVQQKYLVKTMKKLIANYTKLFGDLPYHIIYNSFPKSDFWHFHIEIIPRLKVYGGFEHFGLYINEILPEYAAKKLRFR